MENYDEDEDEGGRHLDRSICMALRLEVLAPSRYLHWGGWLPTRVGLSGAAQKKTNKTLPDSLVSRFPLRRDTSARVHVPTTTPSPPRRVGVGSGSASGSASCPVDSL